MLSDITECHKEAIYAECHNAVCCYTECHNAVRCYAECHNAKCSYAECSYAECRGAPTLISILTLMTLNKFDRFCITLQTLTSF